MTAAGVLAVSEDELAVAAGEVAAAAVSNEEYHERAKSQEMQTPCALPSVRGFDIPREASGNGRRQRYTRGNAGTVRARR
jgi:hypothetical protein